MLDGWNLGSAEVEEVVGPVVGGQEALCLPSRFEALHLPLSPPGRLVRVLRRLVQALVLPVLSRGHHCALCRPVTRQLVGDHHARNPALPFEQLAHQALGLLCVAAALDQDVQHHSALIDRTPQPVLYLRDRDHDLIDVPLVTRRWQPAAGLVGKALPELQRSLAPVDPLRGSTMTDDGAGRGEQFVYHAQAEREAEGEPDGVADDLGRKLVAGVAGAGRCRHPTRLISSPPSRKPASSQVDDASEGAGAAIARTFPD